MHELFFSLSLKHVPSAVWSDLGLILSLLTCNILPMSLHKSGLTRGQLFQGFGVGRIMKGILLRFSVEKWQNYTWRIDFAFIPVSLV